MSTARFIAGGLLSGTGQGMILQAEDRRQEALERVRQLARSDERAADRQFTQERDANNQQFTRDRDAANQQFTQERDANNQQFTLDREAANRDHEGGLLPTAGRGGGGLLSPDENDGFVLTTDDERLLSRLDKQRSGDREAMRAELSRLGRNDLAVLYEMTEDEALRWVRDQDRAGRSWFNRTFGRSDMSQEDMHDKARERMEQSRVGGGASGVVQRPQAEAPLQAATPEAETQEGMQAGIARPKSKEEHDALPSGTPFIAPDGSRRIKP